MGALFGIFLLLVGVSILLRVFTGINLPLGRIAVGVFLIYIGIRVLSGTHWRCWKQNCLTDPKNENTVIFGEGSFKADTDKQGKHGKNYQIVFGKGTIDLTNLAKLTPDQRPEAIEINVVFGEGIVLLDATTQIQIQANAAFGEARMPNGDMVAFGSMNQYFPKPDMVVGKPPVFKIHGNVVFGALRFESVPPKQ